MSTLWTPSGEHEPQSGEGPGDDRPPDAVPDAVVGPPISPEEQAEMERLQAELAATPVADIVGNHVVGLWQLAVLHLGLGTEDPAHLREAQLAIDAVAALVDGLGERLGDHQAPLQDALAQLRLAYVEVSRRGSEGT